MALSRISKLAGDYAGDLALPLSTIASGGSKAVATMQLLGGVLVTKVLGPLGAVAGIVYGITSSFVGWAKSVDLVGQAMDRAAAKQVMVKQFAEITKSVATAKAKLADLLSFAQNAPFSLSNILEGGKALAQVSAGALLTRANLKLVGDAAAASGQQFSTVAEAVGALYDDLKNGRPIHESAEALKSMGVFSQDTIDKLDGLQKSGANITATFGVTTKALEQNAGAMKDVIQTIEDLQEKQGQVKGGILAPAGQIFNDSQKKGIEAQTKLLEKLAPVLTIIFRIVARVADTFGYLQRNVLGLISSIPGLGKIVGSAVTAFTLLAAATAAVSTAKFATFILNSIKSFREYTRAAGGAAAASQAFNMANGGRLVTGISQVASIAAENFRPAGSEGPALPPGFAQTAAKNVAMGAASKIAAGGFGLLGSAASYVGDGLKGLVTGLGGVVTLATAVAVAVEIAYDKFQAATQAIDEMAEASNKSAEAFNKQVANIKTAADAASVYQTAIDAAADAQNKLNDIKNQRAGNGYGGLFGVMDWLNQQDTKEMAANTDVGQQIQNANKVKQLITSGGLALPEDTNAQIIAGQIQHNDAQRQIAMGESNPEQKVEALQRIATNAKREFDEKVKTQTALASAKPEDIAGILAASGSQEMQLQGKVNAIKSGPENALARQQAQNAVEVARASTEDPAGKQAAADAAKAEYDFKHKTSLLEGANLDLQKYGVELDKEGVANAKEMLGAIAGQIALINKRNDLTEEEKQNAIEVLKISQLQAAAEVYRRQQAQKASGLRLGADISGISGNSASARALNAAAENIEENNAEAENRKRYFDQNVASGMNVNDATSEAIKAAAKDRAQDLATKGLANLASISGPVVDSLQAVGLGGGVEQTDPLISISQAQLDALQGIQKTLEDNAKNKDNVY